MAWCSSGAVRDLPSPNLASSIAAAGMAIGMGAMVLSRVQQIKNTDDNQLVKESVGIINESDDPTRPEYEKTMGTPEKMRNQYRSFRQQAEDSMKWPLVIMGGCLAVGMVSTATLPSATAMIVSGALGLIGAGALIRLCTPTSAEVSANEIKNRLQSLSVSTLKEKKKEGSQSFIASSDKYSHANKI